MFFTVVFKAWEICHGRGSRRASKEATIIGRHLSSEQKRAQKPSTGRLGLTCQQEDQLTARPSVPTCPSVQWWGWRAAPIPAPPAARPWCLLVPTCGAALAHLTTHPHFDPGTLRSSSRPLIMQLWAPNPARNGGADGESVVWWYTAKVYYFGTRCLCHHVPAYPPTEPVAVGTT